MDVRSAAQTDHARSIAILVGVGDADNTDHELRPVPATLNSLRAMQRVLTDPNVGGWPTDRVTLLRNPDNAAKTARRLRDLMRPARDTLLLYYAGEANVTPNGQLCLALHDTEPDAPERTGLSYTWLARTLRDCSARRKVVILDCCLPGRTGQFLDPVGDQIADLSDVEGVYTLTSTTRHHPAPVISALQQRPRPTVFTGQLVEMVEIGLPGGPLDLTFEDLYPALRQRLVSMGLPPPNQRGTGGARPLLLARNVAPRSASAAAAVAPLSPSAPPDPIPPPPLIPTPPPVGAVPTPGRSLVDVANTAAIADADADAGLGSTRTAAPSAPAALAGLPANGGHNGHSPTGPSNHGGPGPTTGPTPAVGARPITGQTPVLGARQLAGPEPPRRIPGSDGPPLPPPPTAGPPPEAPSAPAPSARGEPASKPERAEPAANGSAGAPGASGAAGGRRKLNGDGGRDSGGDGDSRTGADPTTAGGGRGTAWSRRRWLAAAALVVALLGSAMYVIRPSGEEGTAEGGPDGVAVDLRDVGNRTISLGRGLRLNSLLQDDDTLWIHSGAPGAPAELMKVDLASGEVVQRVPFPESNSVGTITAGAGSLWVTTSSVDDMGGAVVRIDPDTGEEITTIGLPAWPGRAVFTGGSLWVATVQQPVAEEIGATENAMSSAANALRRIDPETNELERSIQLEGTPVDVGAADGLVLVSSESEDGAAVVAIDPTSGEEVARIPVPEDAEAGADPAAGGPWMLFAADPYAVRVDLGAEELAAVAGPRDGIDMVVPNGEQMWELREDVLTILDASGTELVTATIQGTPMAAAAAGRGAAWIAYSPSDSDEVLITRVPAAELVDLAER